MEPLSDDDDHGSTAEKNGAGMFHSPPSFHSQISRLSGIPGTFRGKKRSELKIEKVKRVSSSLLQKKQFISNCCADSIQNYYTVRSVEGETFSKIKDLFGWIC
ncbi:hypothetical protein AVEN_200866-1 [Araneus ventricosus]|uniref:Uncharacterized protein n=1 Tax=Araneus ventricosus TaxID=182803 RepID=A0A4Y2LYW8_ARAVE|nr:hypothetical protein AVEN_200866-1 [Araneus ventricosus]